MSTVGDIWGDVFAGTPALEPIQAGVRCAADMVTEAVDTVGIDMSNPVRESPLALARATMGPRFKENWHHRLLSEVLEQVRLGKITRLLVEMPPRHSKTEFVSRHFPAHVLGHNPNELIIGCSHTERLAGSINRDVQRIMGSAVYKTAYPNSKIVTGRRGTEGVRNNHQFQMDGAHGGYICAGVNGPITGEGYTLGIIDDPVKNRKDADSVVFRDGQWEWYTSTFLTRAEGKFSPTGGDRQIVTHTRWHEDDLAGRILKKADETGEVWHRFRLAALFEAADKLNHEFDPREEGGALWPDKADETKLALLKNTLGRDFESLFQQNPTTPGGTIIQEAWFRWYQRDQLAGIRFDVVEMSVDASFKDLATSSRVAIGVWARRGPDHYLIDVMYGHMDFPTSIAAIQSVLEKYPSISKKLIEDKANGTAIMSILRQNVNGIIGVTPEGSKIARVNATAFIWQGGNVFLPTSASWLEEFKREVLFFPSYSYDDMVDMATQYLLQFVSDPMGILEALAS